LRALPRRGAGRPAARAGFAGTLPGAVARFFLLLAGASTALRAIGRSSHTGAPGATVARRTPGPDYCTNVQNANGDRREKRGEDMRTGPDDVETATVRESYARAWTTLTACPGRLLTLFILFVLLQIPANMDLGEAENFLAGLYRLLVIGPLTFGLSYAFLVAVRGCSPEVADLFAPFQRSYVAAVTASVLLPIVLMISALPLVGAMAIAMLGDAPSPVLLAGALALVLLPIFAAVRLSFVPYLLVDEDLGPIEVLGESWIRTQPVQMQILGIELASVPLVIVGVLLLLVGVLPAMILAGLALAAIYDAASDENTEIDADAAPE